MRLERKVSRKICGHPKLIDGAWRTKTIEELEI
jgi:hypothetical protein